MVPQMFGPYVCDCKSMCYYTTGEQFKVPVDVIDSTELGIRDDVVIISDKCPEHADYVKHTILFKGEGYTIYELDLNVSE